jgi:hypothetical protein
MKLKWDNTGLKTPLARARGLGASRGHAVRPLDYATRHGGRECNSIAVVRIPDHGDDS